VTLARRATAEALGTGLLAAAVVGSGIMAERLAGEESALVLLANTVATGAALIALILTLGPISGAHFNPVVTLALAARGALARRDVAGYVLAQLAGGVAGVALAHVMFELPLLAASEHARGSFALAVSEVVATFGLLLVVLLVGKRNAAAAPYAVGAYITAAYWFTASTSFANPAVTLARALTPTFAGILPSDVPLFIAAQLVGATLAAGLAHWLDGGAESATPEAP